MKVYLEVDDLGDIRPITERLGKYKRAQLLDLPNEVVQRWKDAILAHETAQEEMEAELDKLYKGES